MASDLGPMIGATTARATATGAVPRRDVAMARLPADRVAVLVPALTGAMAARATATGAVPRRDVAMARLPADRVAALVPALTDVAMARLLADRVVVLVSGQASALGAVLELHRAQIVETTARATKATGVIAVPTPNSRPVTGRWYGLIKLTFRRLLSEQPPVFVFLSGWPAQQDYVA